MNTLEVCEVISRRDLTEFILFPFSLFKGNPYWIPPLIKDEFTLFDRNKNPAFELCELRQWIVRKNGKPVGRISGIINKLEVESTKKGRFGWIDFIDDPEVSKLLLNQVENWFNKEGIEHIHGPFGFCEMDPAGMLVEGFDSPATIATIYNHSYYPSHLEKRGYKKSTDWVEGFGTIPVPPKKLIRAAELIERRLKVKSIRFKSKNEMAERGNEMFNVLNQSFQNLHGFQTLSQNQINFYIDKYLGYLNREFISIIVNQSNEIVGFAIAMPSLSEAFRKANGRLFPLGVFHILRGLRNRKEVDLNLIGVRPDYQRMGIVALMFRDLFVAFKRHGFETARSYAILEDNHEALNLFSEYKDGIKIHKRRRCYQKSLP